jgi:hypothetical protein
MQRPTHTVRRRSALTVSAATALLVATPLLSACGRDAHPGAAAVVGGQRISMGQLQAKVVAVRNAQRAAPGGDEMIKGSAQLTRATLDSMVRDRIVKRAVKDAGVSITRRDVQRARADLRGQAGGEKQLKAALLRQQAVAPSDINDRLRLEIGVERVAKAAHINPRTARGNAALNARLARTSRELNISVNPRYGKWDTKKSSLGDAASPWLRDISGRQAQQPQSL